MPDPLSKPPFSWRRWARGFCVRMSIYWVLYTLSIGPMFWSWYESRFLNGSPWVALFYQPLLFVCDHVRPYGDLVNWYIDWWILS